MATRKKEPSERDKLLKELRGLIKEVDEEGLAFLIQQARVILHNMKIDELNREAEQLHKEKRAVLQKGGRKTASGKDTGPGVSIERGSFGRSYILVINGQRKIIDQEEILSLAEIARAAKTENSALDRLYRWLESNRDDILLDAAIDPKDENLRALYGTLKTQFKPKK